MKNTFLLLTLMTVFIQVQSQSIYKTAHTYLGKTKQQIVSIKGSKYEITDDGSFLYAYSEGKGISPAYLVFYFKDEVCYSVNLMFHNTQVNSVKKYMNNTFKPDEAKIPSTEFWVKMWIEKEGNLSYSWSLTEKPEYAALSILFWK